MLRIGVTGGIGTGKTVVCQIFKTLGAPIYNADARSKALYTQNAELKAALITRFGQDVYENHELNRDFLGSKVFNNDAELKWLNSLVHPLIFKDYETWCKQHEKALYTIKEAAIMIESGSHKNVDVLVAVAAPEKLRIKRVMARDGISEAMVKARMAKQMPQEDLITQCHFVIQNDENESLISQVLALHKRFIKPEFRL
jgi:dephospho-CoA kinase